MTESDPRVAQIEARQLGWAPYYTTGVQAMADIAVLLAERASAIQRAKDAEAAGDALLASVETCGVCSGIRRYRDAAAKRGGLPHA